ncbi:TPA: hypothetical protein ACOEAK_004539 [Enterobacter ludwigii]
MTGYAYVIWHYLTQIEIMDILYDDTILIWHFPYLENRQIA